jgi:hypothetical protein
MRTDDDLTTLLRRGFTQASEELEAKPDLVRDVRRRYARARRRHLLLGLAVPAVAFAAGSSLVLIGRDSQTDTPSQTAASPSQTAAKPTSYKLIASKHSPPANCPANATAPLGKSENPEGVWFWTKEGTCVFVHIDWANAKPASAVPVHLEGYPGLYGTLEKGVRAIYAPVAPGANDIHPSGGWAVLRLPANAPEEKAVHLIVVPANP